MLVVVGDDDAMRRKKRVSEPAPKETICFFWEGCWERKREISLSIAVVRT